MADETVRDDVARAIAMMEGVNLDWITDQSNPRWRKYRQLAGVAIVAYEAAKPVADIDALVAGITPENLHGETEANPVAPMSTRGEPVAWLVMVPNFGPCFFASLSDAAAQMAEEGSAGSTLTPLVPASRIEALEALVASHNPTAFAIELGRKLAAVTERAEAAEALVAEKEGEIEGERWHSEEAARQRDVWKARALTAEAALAKAVEDEREACAKVAEGLPDQRGNSPEHLVGRRIAIALRARTATPETERSDG